MLPSDYLKDLLRKATFNARAKKYDAARSYLELALELADDRESLEWILGLADDKQVRCDASFKLSQLTNDQAQKRK